ncbi:MAG: sugar transferase [Planctomycetota bacterium]
MAIVFDGLVLMWAWGCTSDLGSIVVVAGVSIALLYWFRQYDFRIPMCLSLRVAAFGFVGLIAIGLWSLLAVLTPFRGPGFLHLWTFLGLACAIRLVLIYGASRCCRTLVEFRGSEGELTALVAALKDSPAWAVEAAPSGAATEVWHLPDGFAEGLRVFVHSPSGRRIQAREWPIEGLSGRVKRLSDLLFAVPLFLALVPVLAVLWLLVRITQGSPGFYKQVRLTEGGRPFHILKIRSMKRGAELDNKPVWPGPHDDRITALGRWLRCSWADELPQLWNVVRGDLSLIGPRPERPEFVQVFTKSMTMYPHRHCARGGLTGLAQAFGYVGNTSIRRRLDLDLAYVNTWSPCLDLFVVFATARQFFLRHHRKQFDFVPGRDPEVP